MENFNQVENLAEYLRKKFGGDAIVTPGFYVLAPKSSGFFHVFVPKEDYSMHLEAALRAYEESIEEEEEEWEKP